MGKQGVGKMGDCLCSSPVLPRLVTSVRQVALEQKEPGPTGSGTGRSWFLLSSGCDRSGYY